MARPIEIDRDEALAAATELFWRQGYRATSLQNLLTVTGMGRGSFYAAFESKEALFEAAIGSYRRDFVSLLQEVRTTATGLTALRSFLDRSLIQTSDAKRRRGCLLVNSVLELEGVDERLHRLAAESLGKLDRAVIECLEEAARDDELREGLDVAAVGALLTALIEGWRVASRTGITRQALRGQADQFFALIGDPADTKRTRRKKVSQ